MRVFGLLGLVLALLIVGFLASKQMRGAAPSSAAPGANAPAASSVRDQSQQVQQQFKQSLDAAMQKQQQQRTTPDE